MLGSWHVPSILLSLGYTGGALGVGFSGLVRLCEIFAMEGGLCACAGGGGYMFHGQSLRCTERLQ